jgi:hypothetical protein
MVCGGLIWNFLPQPPVSDQETEELVDEKIDVLVFWKGIEGGFTKRGQASEKKTY